MENKKINLYEVLGIIDGTESDYPEEVFNDPGARAIRFVCARIRAKVIILSNKNPS